MFSAKHRHYELKSSGKCFIYGKLLRRHTNKVSLRFLLCDTLHAYEAFFTGYQEGNIVDNHS